MHFEFLDPSKTFHNLRRACALALLCALTGCSVPTQPAPAIETDAVYAYGFRSMAFDGQRLWQYVREQDNVQLRAYNLKGQLVRKLPLQTEMPIHRSMEWAPDGSLWLLDASNTLYHLDANGKPLAKLPLDIPGKASLLSWQGDQLWVFRPSYYDAQAGKEALPAFLRLDPDKARLLETVEVQDEAFKLSPFEDIVNHQGAFYLSRSHIFKAAENFLYKVKLKPLQLEKIPLPRVFTGLPTLFFVGQQLYGLELLEFQFCHDQCRGILRQVPTAGPT